MAESEEELKSLLLKVKEMFQHGSSFMKFYSFTEENHLSKQV